MIVVLAIVGMIFGALVPNFSLIESTDISVTLGRLASDVRNAFDTAVLTGKSHRMVFEPRSGQYWLEVVDREDFKISTEKQEYDLSPEEEREQQEIFDQTFQEFEDLAGEEIIDPETDEAIKPESPVLKAKKLLRPAMWSRVNYSEWGERTLAPLFVISEMLVEHHDTTQFLSDLPENGRFMLYFFPQGYVERAQIKVAFRLNEIGEINTEREPYVLTTDPFTGTVDVSGESRELELKDES